MPTYDHMSLENLRRTRDAMVRDIGKLQEELAIVRAWIEDRESQTRRIEAEIQVEKEGSE